MYSFNLTGYDESGDFLLLSGNIDSNNGEYLAVISDDDESGNFVDKSFTITPDGDSVVISSDDDALVFLCAQYQYFSEVDALEADASDFDGEVTDGIEGGGTYENDTDLEALEQIPYIPTPQSNSIIGKDFDLFVEEQGYISTIDYTDDYYLSNYFNYTNINLDGVRVYNLYIQYGKYEEAGVKDNKIVFYSMLGLRMPLSEILSLDEMPAPYIYGYNSGDFKNDTALIWRYDDGYLVILLFDTDYEKIMRGVSHVRSIQVFNDLRYSSLYRDGIPIKLN